MKLNKLFKYILAALITIGSVTSCKDYLELKPITAFGPDNVFSSVDNATRAILGVYMSLTGDQGYGIRVSMYYPYDNDEMMGQGGGSTDGERREIAHFTVNAGNTQLAAPFNQMYIGIERANICIYYIPKMNLYANGTESEKKELRRLHGEALTLRAQFYYELIRNWGDVPAQFLPSSFEGDLFKAKMDRDEIYEHLIEDLAEATTLVPWRSEIGGIDERITQGAVRALRARIALFRGGYSLRRSGAMERGKDHFSYYQIARDECNTIIQKGDHKLNPSFLAVFKDAINAHKIEPNGEVIWEVGMFGTASQFGGSKLGYYNGPRLITSGGSPTGNGALTILPTYFYSFDSTDTRRDVTCAPYNVNFDATIVARTLEVMVDGKFRRDWIINPDALYSTSQYFGVNWPLIRYSDVLLMFAEAENEINGPTALAKDALSTVRKRAFSSANWASKVDDYLNTVSGSKEAFFKAIVDERSWELCGEGVRKYDLIRWNLMAERIQKTKDDLNSMANRVPPYDKLPIRMYFQSKSTSLIWLNSFYKQKPNLAPPGADSVNWITASGINGTLLVDYAVGFKANKSELLPISSSVLEANTKLTQDYGY